jgi:hypothetical protein
MSDAQAIVDEVAAAVSIISGDTYKIAEVLGTMYLDFPTKLFRNH